MSAEQLVAEGLILMLVGMGTVFAFLTALVAATRVMSSLLARYPDSVTTVETVAPRSQAAVTADEGSPELIAAISAAIHRHRRKAARRRKGDSS